MPPRTVKRYLYPRLILRVLFVTILAIAGIILASVVPFLKYGYHQSADDLILAHISDTNNPHATSKGQTGLGNVPNLKATLDAVVLPIATDDAAAGYAVGSLYIDIAAGKSYVCISSINGAAVWSQTSLPVFGNQWQYKEDNVAVLVTSPTPTYVDILVLTTPSLAMGEYCIAWNWDAEYTTSGQLIVTAVLDAVGVIGVGRTGSIPFTGGFITMSGFKCMALSGVHVLRIQATRSGANASVRSRRLSIYRVF
jgi:hypothetical protein